MKQLEQRSGDWSVFIEDPQEGKLLSIKRDADESGGNWVGTHEPLKVPFSSAKQIAAEYATHIIATQDPEVRDRVYIGCTETRELERIIVV